MLRGGFVHVSSRTIAQWRPKTHWATLLLFSGLTAACSVVIAWYLAWQGQFTFSRWPVAVLIAVALGNATLEEVIWRGALLRLLRNSGWSVVIAVLVQAVSFGCAHWQNGIPSGPIGALLSALFGLAAGALAVQSRSLLLPILMHWCVDIVIFLSVFR